MTHVIFIHGTGGNGDEAFFPWTRIQLEKLGYKTSAPDLPSTMEPDRDACIESILELYSAQEDTIFIGRSSGGSLIPHLLERDHVNALAAFSIAAPINDLGWDNLRSFFSVEADFEKAKQSVKHYFHWYSDDDPYVSIEHGKKFQQILGGELRIFPGYHHFLNEEFPELVEAVQAL